MRRLDHRFLSIASGFALLASLPQPTLAQGQSKIPTIGLLHAGDETPSAITSGFRQGLKELGYSEGDNVHLEPRWAHGRLDRLKGLAAELAPMTRNLAPEFRTLACALGVNSAPYFSGS